MFEGIMNFIIHNPMAYPKGPSDNDNTRYWPPGSLHTLGIGVAYNKGIKILCIEYILWRVLTTKSMFGVTIMLKD